MLSASGIFKLLLPRDDHNRNALSSSFFLFMDAINDDYTQTRATATAAVDGQVFIYFFLLFWWSRVFIWRCRFSLKESHRETKDLS